MAIDNPHEGKNAIIDWLINSTKAEKKALPNIVLDRLFDCAHDPSPVSAVVTAAEVIYAKADDLPNDLLNIGADLAAMAAQFNFHGMGDEARGFGIARELRKRKGVQEAVELPKEAPAPALELVADVPAPIAAPDAPSAPVAGGTDSEATQDT